METHYCQAKQPSVSSRPNKQWLFTTAQQGTCKIMLNIYLVQLFSNWVCGNNTGCLKAPRAGTSGHGVKNQQQKKGIKCNWTNMASITTQSVLL